MMEVKELIEAASGFSVLYLEDEKPVRDEVSDLLKIVFSNVFIGKDGLEGSLLYKENEIDIVLTDITMPNMNGLEFAEQIRKKDRDIPIVLVTAFNDSDFLLKAIDIGIDKYLLKPINKEKLYSVLADVISMLKIKKEKEALEKQHIATQACLTKALELSHIGCWEWNIDNDNIWYSDSAYDIFELSRDKKDINLTSGELFENIHKDERDNIKLLMENSLKNSKSFNTSFRYKPLNSEDYKVLQVSDIVIQNERHVPSKIIGVVQDVTDQENEKSKLVKAAANDLLTGLINKSLFNIFLKKQYTMMKRYSYPLSILMFNIKGFKNFNDKYGTKEADILIVEIVRLINSCIREHDVFARLSGVEFAILAPKTNLLQSKALITKLQNLIAEHSFEKAHGFKILCNFGVTELLKDDTIETFVFRAEKAFKEAKMNNKALVALTKSGAYIHK